MMSRCIGESLRRRAILHLFGLALDLSEHDEALRPAAYSFPPPGRRLHLSRVERRRERKVAGVSRSSSYHSRPDELATLLRMFSPVYAGTRESNPFSDVYAKRKEHVMRTSQKTPEAIATM